MIAREFRYFLIALQFLTRIRIKTVDPFPEDWLPRSAKYMPLVGALVGVIAGGAAVLSALFFPGAVPVVIGLCVAILLTGALHEDGLADTADAFGASDDRARCLEIMKDSRIGTYGVLALVAMLLLKVTSLAAVDPLSVARILIAGYAGARLAAVLALAFLPYAGGEVAKASRTSSRMTAGELAIAIILAFAVGFLVLDWAYFVTAFIGAAIAAAVVAAIARRKFGGYTGDVLGAVEQVYETAFISIAAALIAGPG